MHGRFFLYAAYCAADLFRGWHLYAAPVRNDGRVDHTRAVWLDYEYRLAAVGHDLGLLANYPWMQHPTERQTTHRAIVAAFRDVYPAGVVCQVADDGRQFTPDAQVGAI